MLRRVADLVVHVEGERAEAARVAGGRRGGDVVVGACWRGGASWWSSERRATPAVRNGLSSTDQGDSRRADADGLGRGWSSSRGRDSARRRALPPRFRSEPEQVASRDRQLVSEGELPRRRRASRPLDLARLAVSPCPRARLLCGGSSPQPAAAPTSSDRRWRVASRRGPAFGGLTRTVWSIPCRRVSDDPCRPLPRVVGAWSTPGRVSIVDAAGLEVCPLPGWCTPRADLITLRSARAQVRASV